MKISTFKRLITEDFPQQYQELIGKLAYPVNLLMEQFSNALNNNLSFSDNLYVQVKDLLISTDPNGQLKGQTAFKTSLRSKSTGIFVIKVDNLSNSGLPLTTAPFVSYVENNSVVSISYITGLAANTNYRVRIVSVG